MGWLIPIAYVVIGCMLIPRFTRATYPGIRDRWKLIQTESQSLREAAFAGWAQSILWPVFLVIDIAVARIKSEQRAEAAEAERAKTVAGAKAVIARYEEEERRKWAAEFRNGGAK